MFHNHWLTEWNRRILLLYGLDSPVRLAPFWRSEWVLPHYNRTFSTIYGLVISSFSLIFVNGINLVLSAYCVLVFYSFTIEQKQKKWIQVMLISASCAMLAVLFHACSQLELPLRRVELGIINNCITIFLFASPLSTVKMVIQTRNAISIPKVFSILSFCTSLAWFSYGFLINDFFVMLPNAIGMMLTVLQLVLIFSFGQHESVEKPSSHV